MDKKYVLAKWIDRSVWPHKTIEKMKLDFNNIDRIYAIKGSDKIRICTNGFSTCLECDQVEFLHWGEFV